MREGHSIRTRSARVASPRPKCATNFGRAGPDLAHLPDLFPRDMRFDSDLRAQRQSDFRDLVASPQALSGLSFVALQLTQTFFAKIWFEKKRGVMDY